MKYLHRFIWSHGQAIFHEQHAGEPRADEQPTEHAHMT
jgi:hypothetical protein